MALRAGIAATRSMVDNAIAKGRLDGDADDGAQGQKAWWRHMAWTTRMTSSPHRRLYSLLRWQTKTLGPIAQ